MSDGTVTIKARKPLVVTENHGGYRGDKCIWCGAVGWLDKLAHAPECPVPEALWPSPAQGNSP